jgi:hypothetical protein
MKIFLSHASQDKSTAASIAFSLRGRGYKVFLDRDDLPAGESYDGRIGDAVKDSDIFIFLISPDSVAQGRFTLTELTFARRKWNTPNGRVLPVMARKTPLEQVPEYLTAVTILEPLGNITAETSAAIDDMRSGLMRSGSFVLAMAWRRYRYVLALGVFFVVAGMVAYFSIRITPIDSTQDESLVANGTTPPFYSCSAHTQCQAGTVCVDDGGDKQFFCKPICDTDATCTKWPYPGLRCLVHLRTDGTKFSHRVCNDISPSYLR